jgi:hypothetical protein
MLNAATYSGKHGRHWIQCRNEHKQSNKQCKQGDLSVSIEREQAKVVDLTGDNQT